MNHSEIETREDLKKYLSNTTVENTFIKFGATWCGPCKAIAPTIKSLNEQCAKANKVLNFIDCHLFLSDFLPLYGILRCFIKLRLMNEFPHVKKKYEKNRKKVK